MRNFFIFIKLISKIGGAIFDLFCKWYVKGCLMYHHVEFSSSRLRVSGFTRINIGKGCLVKIGKDFALCSGASNGIDTTCGSKINVKDGAQLAIGKHTGMTNVVIQCHQSITIGDYVNIGAGSMIFDTDFHSLDWHDRKDGTDIAKRKKSPVIIKNLAFIGAHSIILKGVTIGEKSIIGAGSVVANDVPDGEIWAGNPARFIRKIDS